MKWVGLGLALLIGVIAASVVGKMFVRASHMTLVKAYICSPDHDTRLAGWSLVDSTWSETERTDLERSLQKATIDVRQDAVLSGFEPSLGRAPFAEAIVDVLPHRANEWLGDSDGSPAWTPVGIALLQSDDPLVRRTALEHLVRMFPTETLASCLHAAIERERDVLAIVLERPTLPAGEPPVNASLRSLVEDRTVQLHTRRRAAWHLNDLDDGTMSNLLSGNPADDTNSVYLTALITEKHLSQTAQKELVERWLSDQSAHRRRTAAMLTALRGFDASALRHAESREQASTVVRTFRLALHALDSWTIEGVSAEAYQARTRLLPNGDPDPDALLLGLLGGDPAGLKTLTERINDVDQPPWRVVVLGRVVPAWHTILTQPPATDLDTLNGRFDRLEAHRLLLHTTSTFDESTRRWVAKPTTSQDDDPHE